MVSGLQPSSLVETGGAKRAESRLFVTLSENLPTDFATVILPFYRLGLDGMKMQVNFVLDFGQYVLKV